MALNKRKVLEAARKFAQKGAKAKALKEYNKLLQADARDAKLLLEVGDAYRRWGQNEEAIAQYGKVAQQYRQDGFDARAVAVFKQILNLDPKNYGAYVSLSELYQRMGLDSEAVSALQTAADGYHKEGRKSEALELLRQMAALDPTNTTSRLKVAELLRQEGMNAEAVAEYDAVIQELENQDDRDQLIVVYERILEVQPEQLSALTGLVRQLMVGGELDRAEPLAEQALGLSGDPTQYELLMDLYAQMGNESKLADATRGLAKLYRERGDDEKARELMQRLPVDEAVSGTGLAVDVSEVAEPDLADEELLNDEEPFLALDDQDALGGGNAIGLDLDLGEVAEEIELDVTADDEGSESPAEAAASSPEVLPEGDPDQLLAEASVYLRYGKREQAIASLRGVLAQEPNHRAALEKLGEAYADNDQNSEAVRVWLQAAEQIRAQGDAPALDVLRERIAAIDPAMAEQVGVVDAGAAAAVEPAEDPPPAPVVDLDLDLDLEVELDLDNAIDEVSDSETMAGLDFTVDSEEFDDGDDFEIDLDDDAPSLEESAASAAPPASKPAPVVEATTPDFDSTEPAEEGGGEFEVDSDSLSFDESSPAEAEDDEVGVEFDLDEASLSAPPVESQAGQSTTTTARINEELEEAEFYIAQEMYDEAEGILQRILDLVPNHPAAMLRIGEVASARGQEPDEAGAQTGAKSFENTARFEDLGEDTFVGASETEAADALEDDGDFEVDLDLDDEEEGVDADFAAEPAEEDQTAEGVSLDLSETPPESDPADTFDLREALSDVFSEEEEEVPAPDSNVDSGVLSTVEDGFDSIFSDFKKGVTETLDDGDYDTRYDLGIAYREMGLFEDAIGEFRVCLDSTHRRFDSLHLMGLCARDLGRFADAVNHLEQALAMPDLSEERMAGTYFDLAEAQAGGGDQARACASLRRVIELEPEFPGAADRLAALEAGEAPSLQLGEAGSEFESFDDIFGEDEDESGDVEVAEAVSAETYESFDDLVTEAESVIGEAHFMEAELVEDVAEVEAEVTSDDENGSSKKGGRKKISFV